MRSKKDGCFSPDSFDVPAALLDEDAAGADFMFEEEDGMLLVFDDFEAAGPILSAAPEKRLLSALDGFDAGTADCCCCCCGGGCDVAAIGVAGAAITTVDDSFS